MVDRHGCRRILTCGTGQRVDALGRTRMLTYGIGQMVDPRQTVGGHGRSQMLTCRQTCPTDSYPGSGWTWTDADVDMQNQTDEKQKLVSISIRDRMWMFQTDM